MSVAMDPRRTRLCRAFRRHEASSRVAHDGRYRRVPAQPLSRRGPKRAVAHPPRYSLQRLGQVSVNLETVLRRPGRRCGEVDQGCLAPACVQLSQPPIPSPGTPTARPPMRTGIIGRSLDVDVPMSSSGGDFPKIDDRRMFLWSRPRQIRRHQARSPQAGRHPRRGPSRWPHRRHFHRFGGWHYRPRSQHMVRLNQSVRGHIYSARAAPRAPDAQLGELPQFTAHSHPRRRRPTPAAPTAVASPRFSAPAATSGPRPPTAAPTAMGAANTCCVERHRTVNDALRKHHRHGETIRERCQYCHCPDEGGRGPVPEKLWETSKPTTACSASAASNGEDGEHQGCHHRAACVFQRTLPLRDQYEEPDADEDGPGCARTVAGQDYGQEQPASAAASQACTSSERGRTQERRARDPEGDGQRSHRNCPSSSTSIAGSPSRPTMAPAAAVRADSPHPLASWLALVFPAAGTAPRPDAAGIGMQHTGPGTVGGRRRAPPGRKRAPKQPSSWSSCRYPAGTPKILQHHNALRACDGKGDN